MAPDDDEGRQSGVELGICFELRRMTAVIAWESVVQLYWTMECGSGLFDCQALSDSGEKAKRVLMKR